MVKVSNFTVGELRKTLEQFDDDREIIVGDSGTPLDINNVKLQSYDPEGFVQDNHIDGEVLSVVINVSSFNLKD